MTKLNKKFIWAILLGVATTLVISLVSDFNATIDALSKFKVFYLPLILGLTFLNYVLRFVKWQYLLRIINIKLPAKQSFTVFLSGLAMSVTPGKVGELLKSFLLKELTGAPISRTAPIIFAERLSDGIALVVLSLAGMWYFEYGKQVVIFAALFLFTVILLMQFPDFTKKIIGRFSRFKLVKGFENTLHNLVDSFNELLKPMPLLFTVGIGVVSWFFECLAFYLVFKGLEYNASLLAATFTLSFSGIVGAISMLPGGLGAAEGSILGLLVLVGVPRNIAAVATILIRFCTLWFGVLVGLLALVSNKRILGFAKEFEARNMEKGQQE